MARNVVVVMTDTLRRDHVAAYEAAPPWSRPGHEDEPFVETPNLDRLARQSALFDRFYCASYPTIPCRYDLFTGKYGFPFRGWQPLEPEDVVLSDIVAKQGLVPGLIFDTPPLGNDDYNFTRGFESWLWVRGQHGDRLRTTPRQVEFPAAPRKIKTYQALYRYLRNITVRRSEADWMVGRTMTEAMAWIEENRATDGFVLWVDTWDPHEPFDAPDFDEARYVDLTYQGDRVIVPRYGRPDYMSDAERDHVRALYAAQVTLVDRWIGRLVDKIDAVGLGDDTMIVVLSDHGHLFAEHGLQGKPTGPLGMLYEVTTRVPLIIRHPDGLGAGQRVQGIAQHPDLLPTILDFLGVPAPATVEGESLLPLMAEPSAPGRQYAFSGRYSRTAGLPMALAQQTAAHGFDGWAGLERFGEPFTVTSRDWALIVPPGRPRELYDLTRDPSQNTNVLEQHPEVARELLEALLGWLRQIGAPSERISAYAEAGSQQEGLPRDTELFVIHDAAGMVYAHLDEPHAREALLPDLPPQPIVRQSYGELLRAHPKALIYVHEQYYWADDLA